MRGDGERGYGRRAEHRLGETDGLLLRIEVVGQTSRNLYHRKIQPVFIQKFIRKLRAGDAPFGGDLRVFTEYPLHAPLRDQ